MSIGRSKLSPRLFPLLSAVLLAAACSDSTEPSSGEQEATSQPTIGAPAGAPDDYVSTSPAEPAAGTESLRAAAPDASAGPRLSAAAVASSSYTKAYCVGGWGSRALRVPTQGGVQFKRTGSAVKQRVWFRANFWRQRTGFPASYLSSSEWFYTDLGPGQQSTTVWYRPATGQWNSWQTTRFVPGEIGYMYYADIELQWFQNGRLVAKQLTRATHIVSGPDAVGGYACYWYHML